MRHIRGPSNLPSIIIRAFLLPNLLYVLYIVVSTFYADLLCFNLHGRCFILHTLVQRDIFVPARPRSQVQNRSLSLLTVNQTPSNFRANHPSNGSGYQNLSQSKDFFVSPSSMIQVHVVWVSRNLGKHDRLSTVLQRNSHAIDSWRSSSTNVTLWDNQMIRAIFPEYIQMFEELHVSAWISDIVRYLIVHRFGGVYLDADIIAINNDLRSLLARTQGNFSVCQTPWVEYPHSLQKECASVANGILAAPPSNEAVSCALEVSLKNTRDALRKSQKKFTADIAGPSVWTRCALTHKINILDPWTFLPCPFSMQGCHNTTPYMNLSGVYGMHAWEKSWWSE